MADGDITYLAWNDLVGLTRVRGVPSIEMRRRMEYGLGWAVAGQALTPFEHIAPNPWGPMLEVRQTPVADTETKIDIWPDGIPLHFFLCDSMMPDGSTWDCCTRGFMKQALAALKKETGLQFVGAFCRDHGLFLISDEVYREFVYDGRQAHSALSLEGCEELVIVVDSLSKRYSACGIRLGSLATRNCELHQACVRMAQGRRARLVRAVLA